LGEKHATSGGFESGENYFKKINGVYYLENEVVSGISVLSEDNN
jgi:hypothetical protein